MIRWLPCILLAFLGACGPESPPPAVEGNPLLYPKRLATEAPPRYRAVFETTAGRFVVAVDRSWAPRGADRFYTLVSNGYYDDNRLYRVVPGFMVQWGIHGDPVVDYQWRDELLVDDPARRPNDRGKVSFATSGPNARTQEVFINYKANPSLDDEGFAPFGEVVEGMDVVDALYAEYGDGPPRGDGPYQRQATAQGNPYFDENFPELDRIERAWIEEPAG